MRLGAIALLFLAATAAAGERIDVPRGRPARIDGSVSPQEWSDAARILLRGGGEAFLKHDGTFVYIALVSEHPGTGSICARERNDVRILHASGALGTATYSEMDGRWFAAQAFRWSNRNSGEDGESTRARMRFLNSDRWFGSVMRQSREREFQIRIDAGSREMPIVLGFLEVEPETRMHTWPGVTDGCANVELAQGFVVDDVKFDPHQWGVLVLR